MFIKQQKRQQYNWNVVGDDEDDDKSWLPPQMM